MAKQWSPFLSFHFYATVRRWEIILNETEFWSSRYDFFVANKTTHNWANGHVHRNICLHKPLRFLCVCVCVCVILTGSGRQINSGCETRLLFKNFGFEASTVVQTFWMRSKTFVRIIRNQIDTLNCKNFVQTFVCCNEEIDGSFNFNKVFKNMHT